MIPLLSSVLFAVAFVMSLLSSVVVKAADPVFSIGTPTVYGSGCPANSLTVIQAEDGQSVSMLFSEYMATTTATKIHVTKSCNLALPISVMSGISIGIFQVDYRGSSYVPEDDAKSYTRFRTNYFFPGTNGPTYEQIWPAGSTKDIMISNQVGMAAVVWSPCGASTILRVNTDITAHKGKRSDEDPQITIDTVDTTVKKGIQLFVTYKECE